MQQKANQAKNKKTDNRFYIYYLHTVKWFPVLIINTNNSI